MTSWLLTVSAVVLSGVAGFLWSRSRARVRYQSDIQTARAELSALQQLTLTISETMALGDVVGEIAQFARAFVEADGVLVALALEESVTIQIAAADGSLSTLTGAEIAREDAGLLGEAMSENRVALSHPEADHSPELLSGFEVEIAAVAPLETHGTLRGVLAAVRDGPEPFTSDDIRQLVTVANQTSMALAHAGSVEMLKRGKEQWEATFDALTTGIAVVDSTFRIRRANKALAEMLDRPVTGLIGLGLCEELPGDSKQLGEYLNAVRIGDEPPPLTLHSTAPEKRIRITASGMPGASIASVVVLIEDVTERKVIEEQLIQSEKMAAVGQLVSGVAHDLNNPITSIAGVADLLVNRDSTPPDDLEHFMMIHEQAERASHIVRNLLTFARKDPVETSHADVNDIAQRAAALINHDMKLREVEFELKLSERLPHVRGDSNELQQVVLNLLTNAIQAVAENPPHKPREVTLSTTLNEGRVILDVSDSGPGIDEKLLPQIFLPFVTTKPPGEGTGLGLSMAFRSVQAHDGTIEARPRAVGGVSLIVSLPVDDSHEKRAARAAADSVIHSAPDLSASAGKLSVLVFDENPAVRRSLRLSFAEDGHSVDATRDASQALSLLQNNEYDLIVADARAPNTAGIAFGEVLKKDRPDLCSRTILMTADVRFETDAWLKSLGCVVLRKPFDPAELRAMAGNLLSKLKTEN